MQIFGCEHYIRTAHVWSCAGAPIRDISGHVIGSFCITGPYDSVHPHTLGMVITAVKAIEIQLQLDYEYEYRNSILQSVGEAIIVVGNNNRINYANAKAAICLQKDASALMNSEYTTIFGRNSQELISWINSGKRITDHEVSFKVGNTEKPFTLTIREINTTKPSDKILIFHETIRTNRLAQRMSDTNTGIRFADLIGESFVFKNMIEMAKCVADGTSNILLLGESGTGKDVFAQSIHNESTRKNGPFLAVNCGAIPRELILSELFGYDAGAFTGAKREGKPGKFELANAGTLFLDEIAELPFDVQSVLLRVLESRSLSRIGGTANIPIDVRILAATNKDLWQEVCDGRFREDLYYRLSVIPIHMAPLRERPEDIPLMIRDFLRRFCDKMGRKQITLSEESMSILCNYDWPGNVRELQNTVERLVHTCSKDEIYPCDLPNDIFNHHALPSRAFYGKPLVQKAESMSHYEKDLLIKALIKNQNNISQTARELGLARATVYNKIKKYNLNEIIVK